MNKLEDGKKGYENIQIPAQLSVMVEKTIAQHGNKPVRKKKKSKGLRYVKVFAYGAAAAFVCFTAALNTSQVFASEVSQLPVIGKIAKVLTIRSYETTEENKTISVQIPEVVVEESPVMEETETSFAQLQSRQFTGDINQEIEKWMNDYVAEAKVRMEEYKEAFIETGGTLEEWNEREMEIRTQYEVKYQQGAVLSFILTADENWSNAYGQRYYYNLNLEDNKRLTLEDILGADYKQIADEAIVSEMKKRMAEDESIVYWGYSPDSAIDEGFQGVDENTNFYINEKGNPVISFEKYEIAPGAMGIQEFEIVGQNGS